MAYRARMRKLAVPVIVTLAFLVTGSAGFPAAAQSAQPTGTAVMIDNFTFGPTLLEVPVGTTVVWTNHDDIPHTVVSDDKRFKSRVLDTDETFSYTFDQPGTYPYFCSLHPKMTGKVVVR